MPVYTYRCDSCGVQFERQQSYSDAPLKVCPECRKRTLKKVISPVGVVFKGSGFYSTDNRSSSSVNSTSSSEKAEKKEGKKENKKEDNKKEEKKEGTKEAKPSTEKKVTEKSE